MPRHLCVVTTAHPYDDVRVYSKVARSFIDLGWKVSWVGVDRQYFTTAPLTDPGVDHYLVPSPRGRAGRLTIRRSLRAAALKVPDVDWYYTPDPDGVTLALGLARKLGGSVVFDIHEAFHGALLTRWTMGRKMPLLPAIVRRWIIHLASRCGAVSAVSQSLLKAYAGDLPADQVVLLRNAAPLGFSDGAASRKLGSGRPVRFMHGKALANNGTPVLLDAARLLLDRGCVDFQIVLFDSMGGVNGAYDPQLLERIGSLGLADVIDVRPGVPHPQMPAVLDTCDVGLISYGRDLGVDSLPNRFFEYLARALPVIVPDYSPEMREVVIPNRLGITADFEDPWSVAAALEHCVVDRADLSVMGQRSLELFKSSGHWEHDFGALVTALENRQLS